MKRFRFALIALMMLALLPASPASAHTPTHAAPDVYIASGYAFRSLVSTDDLFFVIRYELDKSIADATTDAWCAELEDTDGCDSTPATPTNPTSLTRGAAYATLYSDGYGGTLVEQVTLTRIDHALAGIYVDAGHSITWENGLTQVCIESSTTLFSSTTFECLYPVWNSADNNEFDQRAELANVMMGPSGPMVSLESERLEAELTYINGTNLITPAGRVFALEALSFMDRIIPEAFQVGAEASITSAIATPSSDPDIQVMIDATATASGLTEDLENVGQQYLGISGPTTAMIGVFVASIGLGGLMWNLTKSNPVALLGALTPLTWGLFMRGPTFAVIAAMITIFGTLGAWYFVRKAPS